MDQSDAQLSRFTWAELVQEATFVFQRDGSSPSSVLNFVKALSKFESVPESCTGEIMKEFSVLFQQNIIDKLDVFNAKSKMSIHHHVCLILVTQFDSKQRMQELGLRKESVQQLDISSILDSEHVTDEHAKVTMDCARLLLARLPHLSLEEVLEDPAHFHLCLRDECIAQQDYRDRVEERLAQLEASSVDTQHLDRSMTKLEQSIAWMKAQKISQTHSHPQAEFPPVKHVDADEDADSKHAALVFQIEKLRSHVDDVAGKMQAAITTLQASPLELGKKMSEELAKQSEASESGFAAVQTNLKSLN